MSKEIKRTIQYWRLVDASDGSPMSKDFNWIKLFSQIDRKTFSTRLAGRDCFGKIFTLSDRINSIFSEVSSEVATQINYGIVLASDKDYIPNQQDKQTGNQSPVVLNQGWDAIDNSFIWHLPFGNMFAILLESQTSSRAEKYASWLTQLLKEERIFENPNFRFSAEPVVDRNAIEHIRKARGLRSVVLRANYGRNASNNLLGNIFSATQKFENVEVEIKVKVKRGISPAADEVNVLNWFNDNFGRNVDSFSRATATMVNDSGDATEINLIKERLTRKKTIRLNQSAAPASIDRDVVFEKIAEAYVKDYQELCAHRDDGRL